jgi:dihydroorotate dehydrogenase (NAD+) catalytic subunit
VHARAIAEAGADVICIGNTLQAMLVDVEGRKPVIGMTFAGLSGPALKPVNLRQVYQVAQAVDIPIIGCGGISTAADALEYIMAGASAVQVGTATFANPLAPIEVLDDLISYCEAHGVDRIVELVGAANKRPTTAAPT